MLSIIIPCHNEEEYIIPLLSLLASQIHDHLVEIIVVDNNSTDQTKEVVQNYLQKSNSKILLVSEPRQGVSYAKNKGASVATFENLLFLDADLLISHDFLNQVIKCINNGYSASTIRTLSVENRISGNIIFWTLELIKEIVPRPFGKFYVKKQIFDSVGGFNNKIVLGENLEVQLRIKKYIKENMLGTYYHLRSPIYCSLRRFQKKGYAKILAQWFVAYLGFWKLKYPTMSDL